ncbi:hypothetical protein JY651_18335 [Pyxidicoccus parkwayensis]|uniref:Uncharacterized protein n=1 Tax=Pyxidicoccus parkwayensis TaxID=2813578 RepID=A0ABX7P8F0_9BACT|nr:hypothetical protein [Pyxidicoccus parkwaysis]QSQ26761.1 hypothetical protein JY651_18335 [Pyxidicoccus parkwaysis]
MHDLLFAKPHPAITVPGPGYPPGMPHVDYVIIRGCEAPEEVRPILQRHDITAGPELHEKKKVEQVLLDALEDFPDALICVVFQDTAWEFKHGVFLASDSGLDEAQVSWSLKEDELAAFEVPDAEKVKVPLSVDADSLLDLFDDTTEDASAEEHLLSLPERFFELPKARQVLAQVAAVLKPKQCQVLVDIAGHYFVATLERKKGVTLAPLYPWVEDGEARKRLRSAVGTPAPESFEPCPKKERARGGSKRDPQRPFTTGSLKARVDSVQDAPVMSRAEYGHRTFVDTPGAFEQLEAALRAPENAGPGFAQVRRALYQVLFKYWPEKTRPLLFSGLDAEQDDAVRGQLYACLSKVEEPAAYHALARGMKVEPPGVIERLSQVIWRQKATVELLVREYLVPAWPEDRALAERVVKMLREEYVEIPPAWVSEAPEELLKVLGSVLAKA